MHREGGGFHGFNLVQQMMEGSATPAAWWSMHGSGSTNSMRLPPPELIFPLLHPPPSSSTTTTASSGFPHSPPQPNSDPDAVLWAAQDHSQDLPESLCQLLLGGVAGEDRERYEGLNPAYQMKKMGNCAGHQHDQFLLFSNSSNLKQERCISAGRSGGYIDQEIQVSNKSPWSHHQQLQIPASSPRSCITSSSFSTNNMLDFSNKPIHHPQPDNNSSECNSTETAATAAPPFKKSRVQVSSSPKSTLKVRKEKLGDRITALHQLVSPFGKTDTASVLQEAIGYIRFLQGQIEALSSPYLQQQQQQQQQAATASAGNNMRRHQQQQHFSNEQSGIRRSNSSTAQVQDMDDDGVSSKKDLRSRGLCLVPVSFTMHVGGDNGADLWAPTLGGGF